MSKIFVFGIGISNIPLCGYLEKQEKEFYVWDDLAPKLDILRDYKYANIQDYRNVAWNEIDTLIIAPGIHLNYPKPHPIVDLARENNVEIICDIEFFYRQYFPVNMISISGTNGKSTTTKLLGELLLPKFNDGLHVAGNIGSGIFASPISKNDIYVLELSSYQLDLLIKTSFSYSILLNITPDHLERYRDMQAYIDSKATAIERLGSAITRKAIINMDDPFLFEIYNRVQKLHPEIEWIKVSHHSDEILQRAFLDKDSIGQEIWFSESYLLHSLHGKHELINRGKNPSLRGIYNGYNIASAVAVASDMGVKAGDIENILDKYKGLPHRMEVFAKYKNITFIDDSKATNPESTIAALESYSNIYLIAGGRNKELDFTNMAIVASGSVKKAFLIGEASFEIANQFALAGIPYQEAGELQKAFSHVMLELENYKASAGEGFIVLLSPACSSLDQFKNFEARGDEFKKIVLSWIENKN